jgi:hypothetical protein
MVKRKKSFKKKQPIAVTIIAVMIVVLFLLRLVQVYDPIVRHQILNAIFIRPLHIGWQLTTLGLTLVTSIGYILLSITGLIVLVGFLRLRRWSWVLLMAWTGASLTISLVDYFTSRANFAVMASNVIIAFALNIPDVQRIYKIRKDDEPAL